MQIGKSTVVVMQYTMRGEDGTVLETTEGGPPAGFLVGAGGVVPGLEAALMGHSAGETVQVTLAPADAYGERKGTGAQAVPRKELLALLKAQHHQHGKADVQVGMPLRVPSSSGEGVLVWVTRVQGAQAWIDVDHPLAGRTLSFECQILLVRLAQPEEIEHNHPHF
jgi:FKBP-type peptidyl-prolyl cis-trans isomerase SlyD